MKHDNKDLPEELIDNYLIIQQASENNVHKILNTLDEQLKFIKKMEQLYNRTTLQHIQYMRDRDFEGNVDERTWHRLALLIKSSDK